MFQPRRILWFTVFAVALLLLPPRAAAQSGTVTDDAFISSTACQDFFTLCKDADPNIPVQITAKSEYAKVQPLELAPTVGSSRLDCWEISLSPVIRPGSGGLTPGKSANRKSRVIKWPVRPFVAIYTNALVVREVLLSTAVDGA